MRKIKEIAMYPHPGSSNHGCEAIVRSTKYMFNDKLFRLYSYSTNRDREFGLENQVDLVNTNELARITFRNIFYHVVQRFTGNRNCYYTYRYKPLLRGYEEVVLSIGGDNYCYGIPQDIIFINKCLKKQGKKLVLWGCSVDTNILENQEVVDDLKSYDLITVRESLTFDALKSIGIEKLILCADPAFLLPKQDVSLPEWFIENKTIGINISPMVLKYEKYENAVINNYYKLIEYILAGTDYNIALIPHVTGIMNNDNDTISLLYDKYKQSGRIGKINVANCEVLKGYISKCRFFIGARTHATIAAYSTCVPTLVVGYSIKALGIAKDIFGDNANYVISAQSFESDTDLKNAFRWIMDREQSIRNHLLEFVPKYIESAYLAKRELEQVIGVE